MIPPKTIDVMDRHGGFTALVPTLQYVKKFATNDGKGFIGWERKMVEGTTLWRPGSILKKGTIGELISYDEKSFFQLNDAATMALYRIKGYRYKVAVWFDNLTGERIA